MGQTLQTFDTAQVAAERCGEKILRAADDARSERGSAALAISGGSTPRLMFEWMARQSFDWTAVHLFWVDERCVPPDDPQSNYRMTKLALLDAIRLEPSQVHRVLGEIDPAEAASRYSEDIRAHFQLTAAELPIFDVVQRGMGPDAHTASLFPGEARIQDQENICVALWVEKMMQHRVTLLRGVLEKARLTVNLVTGTDKAEPLRHVLDGPQDLLQYPAQIASAESIWFLDRQARPTGKIFS